MEEPLKRGTLGFLREFTTLEVKVKFVDIQQSPKSESRILKKTDAEEQKHGDRRGLDTRLVHALT